MPGGYPLRDCFDRASGGKLTRESRKMDSMSLRRNIQVRKFNSNAEADAAEKRDLWPPLTPAERIEATWSLSRELWKLKGEGGFEPGLCRSVARLHRR